VQAQIHEAKGEKSKGKSRLREGQEENSSLRATKEKRRASKGWSPSAKKRKGKGKKKEPFLPHLQHRWGKRANKGRGYEKRKGGEILLEFN